MFFLRMNYSVWVIIAILSLFQENLKATVLAEDSPVVELSSTNEAVALWRATDDSPNVFIMASTLTSGNFNSDHWSTPISISSSLLYSRPPIVKLYEYKDQEEESVTKVTAVAIWTAIDPSLSFLVLYYSILQDLESNLWSEPATVGDLTDLQSNNDYKLKINSSGKVVIVRTVYSNISQMNVVEMANGTIDTSSLPITINWLQTQF